VEAVSRAGRLPSALMHCSDFVAATKSEHMSGDAEMSDPPLRSLHPTCEEFAVRDAARRNVRVGVGRESARRIPSTAGIGEVAFCSPSPRLPVKQNLGT
jgi:hypothetical protein